MENREVAVIVKTANRSKIHRETGISLSGVSRILSGSRVARSTNLNLVALNLGVPMGDLHAYLMSLRRRQGIKGRKRTKAA